MDTNTSIGVIGNGSWATALAKILTDNGRVINWWLRKESSVQHLLNRHHNPDYLTSVGFLPESIRPTSDLQQVIEQSQVVVFAVPSAYAEEVLESVPAELWGSRKLISAVKGIMPKSNLLLNDHLDRHYGLPIEQYVSITGPCHAEEVANERLSYLTFSGLDDHFTLGAAAAFSTNYINTTCNQDIWGAQFAAVLKNIYAVGAGMAHALDYGDNFLSVYITNCYREMYLFLTEHFEHVHPAAERPDFHTSAYLGDLLVTCYSLHSRNRTFGSMIGKGYTIRSATLEMNMVAEGYHAARGMMRIAEQFGIELPIATSIYKVLWEQLPAADMFLSLEKKLS